MTKSTAQIEAETTVITANVIQEWFVSALSEQLRLDSTEINPKARLDSYGLDSANALFLIGKAEKMLGTKISPMMLWHYPTVESLAQRLAEDVAEDESEVFEF